MDNIEIPTSDFGVCPIFISDRNPSTRLSEVLDGWMIKRVIRIHFVWVTPKG
jgi:hypothetical protein